MTRLQEYEGVICEAALVPLPLGQIAQPEEHAGHYTGPSTDRCIGGMKPVVRNVLYRGSKCLQDCFCGGVLWVKPAKGVGQPRQAYRGMVASAIGKQGIDFDRRSSLQDIQIDARIQKQRSPNSGLVSNPREIVVGSALQRPGGLFVA